MVFKGMISSDSSDKDTPNLNKQGEVSRIDPIRMSITYELVLK